jgi:broad specificity phosphatase PhoE
VFGAETGVQAQQRFASSLHGVLARHPDSSIAVVTHGTVLALYLAALLDQDPYALWQRLGLPCYAVLTLPSLRVVEMVEAVDLPDSRF